MKFLCFCFPSFLEDDILDQLQLLVELAGEDACTKWHPETEFVISAVSSRSIWGMSSSFDMTC